MKFIKFRRDKFHAHFDKEYFNDKGQLSNDAPIKQDDFNSLIEVMKDILNKYSAAYDGNLYTLDFMNAYDIDQVLDILHYWSKGQNEQKTG
jgi:hypothetical protein